MIINKKIYNALKENNNIITTNMVVSMGFSKTVVSQYVKSGLLERCRQGVYTLPEEVEDDMYTLMLSSKHIIFSHDTALFLNELSERTPFTHSVTIPSNASLPGTAVGECNCFYVKKELHEMGMIEKTTTFGNVVRCYNAERTLCDILRSRSRVDEELVISAIKNYVAMEKKDLNQLSIYAKKLRVDHVLTKCLEVLL